MKKLTLFFIVALICQATVFSQSCLPAGITFDTQTQIDNFQTDYPGCSEIEGNVLIKNDDITNLIGLNVLISIGGGLRIEDCNVLSSLEGLENITSIGWNNFEDFEIFGSCNLLTDLSGLSNLASVKGININGTAALISLTGLENIISIQGELRIQANESLIDLTGLNNVVSIAGKAWIGENTVLTSLIGLDSLFSIAGWGFEIYSNSLTSLTGLENLYSINGGAFRIYNNNYMTDISALSNLTNIGGAFLEIYENAILSSLDGLDNLNYGSMTGLTISDNASLATCHVQSICDFLDDGFGNLDISNNAIGCNNEAEVAAACVNISVPSINIEPVIVFYPNPAEEEFVISSKSEAVIVPSEVYIYNQIGQLLLEIKSPISVINISDFHSGIYFVEVVMKQGSVRKKLIVK